MKNISILVFTVVFLFVFQIPVFADNVTTWAELDARVTAGDSNITLLNDIINNSGGLVINNSASTTSIGAQSFFISGNSVSSIFNNTGTLSISNGTLENGTTITNGGAISNTGTLNLTDVNFTNNSASFNGGAIYNDGGTITINANGANVSFSGNHNLTGNDIYMNGGSLILNTTSGRNITFSDGIGGINSSTITESGSGELVLSADNSGFLGTFTQTAGTTTVASSIKVNPAKFFGGINNINGGILTFGNSGSTMYSELVSGSSVTLNNNATMNIYYGTAVNGDSITVNNGTTLNINNASVTDNILFNTPVSGTGAVNVSGSDGINFSGNNHNFTGTYTQTSGSTFFNNGFFGGTSNISGGTLELQGGSHLYSGSNIHLTNAGTTMSISQAPKGGLVTLDSGSSINATSGTTLNIDNSKAVDLDFNTTLSGAGTINNTSNGVINFTADNSGFTGTFDQTGGGGGGTSNISNKFFSGTSKIEGGTLNLNSGSSLGATSIVQLTDTGLNTQMNVNDGSSMATGSSISVASNTTLNFNNTATYDLNASVSGSGTINKNNAGTLNVNNSITGGPSINLNAGTLFLANDSYINGSNLGINGGTINTQNGATGTMALNNLAFGGNANWLIDVDLANKIGDKITSTNPVTGAGTLNISGIKLQGDSSAALTLITVADANTKGYLTTSVTSAVTPLYQYNVSYSPTGGTLNFANAGFNPSALTNPVSSATGAFLNQANVYSQALTRAEEFMSLPIAEREKPKLAYIGVFSPTLLPEDNRGLWIKQFTTFENVPLNNGPNVSNVSYFTLIGGDTELTHLKHGYDGYMTAYIGYIGSHQNYSNVGTNQNGALVGLTGTVYKRNFFASITANVGDNAGNANTIYGTDSFNILTAAMAAKAGYNIEFLKGKIILQPSYAMGYVFANTFPYTTASGLNITSNPLNAIQIIPGVKLIGNFKKGWQPYLSAAMVWNIMDNQKFYANDVALPQLSIAPYVLYGFGVQRKWKERFNTYVQVLALGGGRNGVELQFGFRWMI